MRSLWEKVTYYLKNPHLILKDLETSKRSRFLAENERAINEKYPFLEDENGFIKRSYKSQEEYKEHQKSKLEIVATRLEDTYEERVSSFLDIFSKTKVKNGSRVLSLGSRDGAEVDALRRLGCLGIGIDLVYPSNNKFVHYGDFHSIPYPDACFDFVYTNTLDHIKEPQEIFSEIHRVLDEKGVFLCQVSLGSEEGFDLKGSHESFVWKKKGDLIDLIKSFDFNLLERLELENRWELIVFSKS